MILAVDEFNGCFNPTTLKTQQKEWVTSLPPSSLLPLSSLPPPSLLPSSPRLPLCTVSSFQVLPHQLNLVRSLVQHIHQVSSGAACIKSVRDILLCVQFPGAVLLALSRSRMLRCSVTGWTPDDLLMTAAVSTESRTESEVVLKSCRTVEIPPYSRQEMERCLHYLSQSRWVNTGKAVMS